MPLMTVYLSQQVEEAIDRDFKKQLKERKKNKESARQRRLSKSAVMDAALKKHYRIQSNKG